MIGMLVASSIAGLTRLLTGVRGNWAGCEPVSGAPCVYFANHRSHGDAVVMWAVLARRLNWRLRPVGAADYWAHGRIRRFFVEKAYFIIKILLLFASTILSYAVLYRHFGVVDVDKPSSDPVTCLYFSIVTWTTLGYGDVRPTPDARLLAASESVVGYIVMAISIGLFASFFQHLRTQIRSSTPPELT